MRGWGGCEVRGLWFGGGGCGLVWVGFGVVVVGGWGGGGMCEEINGVDCLTRRKGFAFYGAPWLYLRAKCP